MLKMQLLTALKTQHGCQGNTDPCSLNTAAAACGKIGAETVCAETMSPSHVGMDFFFSASSPGTLVPCRELTTSHPVQEQGVTFSMQEGGRQNNLPEGNAVAESSAAGRATTDSGTVFASLVGMDFFLGASSFGTELPLRKLSTSQPDQKAGKRWSSMHELDGSHSVQKACGSKSAQEAEEEVAVSELSESSSEVDEIADDIFFNVQAEVGPRPGEAVEMDVVQRRCEQLRKLMRNRPCLPLQSGGQSMSAMDVSTGVRLPLYSCPFTDCSYHSNNRVLFLHHVAGGVSDTTHLKMLKQACGDDLPWMTRLDYVYGAVAVAERERWPRLGLSTTRRVLTSLCLRYKDTEIKCMACFMCGQLRTTSKGFGAIDLEKPASAAPVCLHEISLRDAAAFSNLERNRRGTLANNCSYNLWRRRYVENVRKAGLRNPLEAAQPESKPWSSTSEKEKHRHISEWAFKIRMKEHSTILFGCTEDVSCSAPGMDIQHARELEKEPFVRTLCSHCSVPVCHDCWRKLEMYIDAGTIPMSLSNDHYYGYVHSFLVDQQVTWLECAASSVCWSTMLVYYLEDPYGHLMKEEMGNPQGRTQVKGNLFSFNMPWEDIEKCCHRASEHAASKDHWPALQQELGLPHSEDTLAMLVNVHIRGGSKDLTMHLKGLTMRVAVVQELIAILRRSGYPGYEVQGHQKFVSVHMQWSTGRDPLEHIGAVF